MKEVFINYIRENFSIDVVGMHLVINIVNWVWLQSMDREDTIACLGCLLDGIGLEEEEIARFIDW